MYDGANGGMYPGSNPGPNPNQNPNTNPGQAPGQFPRQAPIAPTPLPPLMGSTTGNAMVADYWFKKHLKLLILIFIGLVILGDIIFQIVYPSSLLTPGTNVDGVDLGGKKHAEAAKELDNAYGGLDLEIYFGTNDAAFQKPKMKDVGIGVDNLARLSTIDYPFYLRIIPGSIWWAAGLTKTGDIAYTYDKNKIISYTLSKVGEDCSIPPTNATLKLIESQLQVVPSSTGGSCDINAFQDALAQVKPDPDKDNKVRIAIDETPAPISDDMARDLANTLNSRMASPMPITVDSTTATIPGRIVLSWLDFIADVPKQGIDNTGNQQASLKFKVNQERMQDYLDQGIAAKLIKKPGVSRVSTNDFTETSRVNGANGRGLDVPRIAQSVTDYINNKIQQAIGATVVVGPTTVYTRTYTPTSVGFSALLAQFAQDNPGTYAMAFQELSGVEHPRSAQYNGDQKMPAAGVHSLYIGLTEILEQYKGTIRPVDKISGDMNTTDCFKFMFQRSDAGCRNGFYNFFGYQTLASYAQQYGLSHTTFAGDNTVTSANDLQAIMVGLYKGKIARVEGGSKILSTMHAVRNNDGIPAGSDTTNISHVTGEAGGVFNDTAIVYSTDHGAYALTVLSNGEGTSWEKIADLADKVLKLKSVKIPKGAR